MERRVQPDAEWYSLPSMGLVILVTRHPELSWTSCDPNGFWLNIQVLQKLLALRC